jgi:hypothetical protein
MHSRPVSPPVVLLMATLAPAVFSRERAGVQDGVFDVTAFGGVGDGEHNNTAAFRAGAFHFFGRSQHHQHAHRRGTRANTRTNCVPAWERLPCWENLVMACDLQAGKLYPSATVPDCAPLHHHHCDDHTPLSDGTTSVVAVLLDSPAQCFHLPSLGHHADSCSQVDQQSALVPMSSHLPLTHHARTHGRTHARQLLRP